MPCPEYPEEAIVADFQDAVVDQTRHRRFPNLIGVPGRVFHPVEGVTGPVRLRDLREHRIEETIPDRCRVDQE